MPEELVFISVIGSTAAVSTIEFELGLVKDQQTLSEKLVPERVDYAHNLAWGNGNGQSHLRAMLDKTGLVLPGEKGPVVLGHGRR